MPDKYLASALSLLGIKDVVDVVKWRFENDDLVLLVNYGIGGIKKHRIAKSEVILLPAPVPSVPISSPAPVAAAMPPCTEGALRLLERHHLTAANIKGTSKSGRITVADVRRFIKERK